MYDVHEIGYEIVHLIVQKMFTKTTVVLGSYWYCFWSQNYVETDKNYGLISLLADATQAKNMSFVAV